MRARRLRWYGHVQRREEGEALAVVRDMKVSGRRPSGGPAKSCYRRAKYHRLSVDIDLWNDF